MEWTPDFFLKWLNLAFKTIFWFSAENFSTEAE